MSLQPRSRVERYVLIEEIARGGMGVVWRARDSVNGREVALKAVANDLLSAPQFRERMQDEARRHQSLDHPNIVPVRHVFTHAGQTFICMDLIRGESLSTRLECTPGHRLGVDVALRIIDDILSALDHAHQQGVIHRDVKPSNILIDPQGRAHLIDFGIAIALGEERRTRQGQLLGTPLYMSPEQIQRPGEVRHQSDVYAAACVLYEMLTGRPPFMHGSEGVGETDFHVQQAQVLLQPVRPRTRVPSLPQDLDDVIMAALVKDPVRRLPGCAEFASRLKSIAGDGSVDDPPDWRLILACALVVLGVFAAIFVLAQ